MQQMTLNYATIASALTEPTPKVQQQFQPRTQFQPRNQYQPRTQFQSRNQYQRSFTTCYNCEEKGHYARDCLAEKQPTMGQYKQMTQDNRRKNINYIGIEDDDVDEVYITRTPRNQPYSTNRKQAKFSNKNSEFQREFKLRNRTVMPDEPDTQMDEIPVEIPIDVPVTKRTKPKPKFKTYPSVIEQIEPYDVSTDILNMKSSATIGQWLQLPAQRKNLAKILQKKKKPITEANQAETDYLKKTTTMRYHI